MPLAIALTTYEPRSIYLIYELASRNGEPAIHSLFPICNTSNTYHRQVEDRDRLHNVPDQARSIIESSQPYNAKGGKRFSHPLYILNKLTSAEKYQMLTLTVSCRARPIFVLNETNSRKEIEGTSITEAFQHGAQFSEQPLAGIQSDEVLMPVVQVPGWAALIHGGTYARDGVTPHYMGVENENGRLMILMTRNCDLGDAWEWINDRRYPAQYGVMA